MSGHGHHYNKGGNQKESDDYWGEIKRSKAKTRGGFDSPNHCHAPELISFI